MFFLCKQLVHTAHFFYATDFRGGALDERTLRANREAYALFYLRPHVMIDVSVVDTRCVMLGAK
jgi:isopentenyl diphosphate isomerase/L-lactate dehydrogenase-like FMN-dependent dehydrogenase